MCLTSCCFCLDLRKGSIAIGIVYTVLYTLSGLLSIIFLALGSEALTGYVDTSVETLLWLGLVFSAVMLLVSGLLIHGVMTDNTCMALTWLIVHGIAPVLGVMGSILQLIPAFSSGDGVAIIIAIVAVILVAIQVYWFFVVRAYFLRMRMVGRVQPSSP